MRERSITPSSDYLFDHAAIAISDKLNELEGEVDAFITLLHRKVCTTRPHGKAAKNLSYSWLCPAKAMDVAAELNLIMNDSLFAQPHFYPQGVLAAYAQCHVIQDYLRLALICIDKNILTTDELVEMTKTKVLFWCPGVGSLPLAGATYLYGWGAKYIQAASEVEYEWQQPTHPYQKRAIGFLESATCHIS